MVGKKNVFFFFKATSGSRTPNWTKLTRMLLYMLPLLSPRSTLTRMMQESQTCRLYMGRDVMEMERLWWGDGWALGRAAAVAGFVPQRSALQSGEEPDGDSRQEAAEGKGKDDEEEEEEEKASDTLL